MDFCALFILLLIPTLISAACNRFNVTNASNNCSITLFERPKFQGDFHEFTGTKVNFDYPLTVKSLIIRGACQWRLRGKRPACPRVRIMGGNQECEEQSDWGFLANCMRGVVKMVDGRPQRGKRIREN